MTLTHEQLEFYALHGYLIVEKFLTDEEIDMYRDESELLVNHCYEQGDLISNWGCVAEPLGCGYLDDSAITEETRSTRSSYEKTRSQIYGNELVSCTLEKYGHCARQLLNTTNNACLLNEQYIVKPPRSKAAFEWHQDILYFKPEEREVAIVSAWTPLDDVGEENGTVCVEPSKISQKHSFWATMSAGSVLFMDGRLRHCSSGNASAKFRTVYMPQFSAGPIARGDGSLVAFAVPV